MEFYETEEFKARLAKDDETDHAIEESNRLSNERDEKTLTKAMEKFPVCLETEECGCGDCIIEGAEANMSPSQMGWVGKNRRP
jgi:hypothetical protein